MSTYRSQSPEVFICSSPGATTMKLSRLKSRLETCRDTFFCLGFKVRLGLSLRADKHSD
jgi:hypothetical protein